MDEGDAWQGEHSKIIGEENATQQTKENEYGWDYRLV